MDMNLLVNGALGFLLFGIVIWVALKLAKRIIIGVIAIVIVGVLFFGWNVGGFSRTPTEESRSADAANP